MKPVSSLEWRLTYGPSLATPTLVKGSGHAAEWMVQANLNIPGELRIAMAAAAPIPSSALSLRFTTTAALRTCGSSSTAWS